MGDVKESITFDTRETTFQCPIRLPSTGIAWVYREVYHNSVGEICIDLILLEKSENLRKCLSRSFVIEK